MRAAARSQRTVGSGSDACGVVRGVNHSCAMILYTSKLRMRVRASASALAAMRRYGAPALASALAAMRKDAADGEANELPFAWPSQPDRKGCRRRQRGNGGDQRVGSRNWREGGAVGYASRCQRSGSWRSGGAAVPPPAVTHSATDAAENSVSLAPR